MSEYLTQKEQRFSAICKNFTSDLLSPLVACHRINPILYTSFHDAVTEYNNASASYNYVNRTPNGILVPKKEIDELYNNAVIAFFEILKSLKIENYVKRWNIPTIRFKSANFNVDNLKRPYISENPHADCWIGWDPDSLLIIMPLLGDNQKNWVQFYQHPDSFDSSWVRKLDSFKDGMDMVKQCTPLPKHYEKGCIYIADMSVIHETKREPGADWRIGIETVLSLVEPTDNSLGQDTQLTYEEMIAVGKSIKIKAETVMGEIVETTATKRAVQVSFQSI
jgi:hypothetical protein